jgi:hypothetical protein
MNRICIVDIETYNKDLSSYKDWYVTILSLSTCEETKFEPGDLEWIKALKFYDEIRTTDAFTKRLIVKALEVNDG